MSVLLLLLLGCAAGQVGTASASAKVVDPITTALKEVHDLQAERTRLRIHHRQEHPRFAQIRRRVVEIHETALQGFEVVAADAVLECSEEPLFGQPSYGVILYATALSDVAAGELLLFHASHIYRTSGSFRILKTTGAGWYFRANVDIPKGARFVVACIQDAPEELENVKRGFMPNSDRARDPSRPYRTQVFTRDGKPLG